MSIDRAVALNNGGRWYRATSKLRVTELERRFHNESVASVLYDKIGAIVPAAKEQVLIQVQMTADKLVLPDFSDEPVWVQEPIAEPDWTVTLALKELGVTLQTPAEEPYLLQRARKKG
jgi:hypothetical protein